MIEAKVVGGPYSGLWYVAVPLSVDDDGGVTLEAGGAVGLVSLTELSTWKRHRRACGCAGFISYVIQVGVSVALLDVGDWAEDGQDRIESLVAATSHPYIFLAIAEAIKSRVDYEADMKEMRNEHQEPRQ